MSRPPSWFFFLIGFPIGIAAAQVVAARTGSERDADCLRSCEMMGYEFDGSTRYGCFCREDGETFILGDASDVE
jgi:hypothetical protein